MAKVVYLTGAPATGKSSLTRALLTRVRDLKIFEYGEELTKLLNDKGRGMTQAALRTESSKVATWDDIRELDQALLLFIQEHRREKHVIIDSHPVTKERYGFRVTPFALEGFRSLEVTDIWVLYADSEVILQRIADDPQGRPTISGYEAEIHNSMQASVAVTYAIAAGLPVHFFDSSRPLDELAGDLEQRLTRE